MSLQTAHSASRWPDLRIADLRIADFRIADCRKVQRTPGRLQTARPRMLVVLVHLALVFCGAGLPLQAQYRASMQGIVTDPNQAAVPGAALTLTSQETNLSRKTRTSDDGAYTFAALLPGRYTLAVEKPGFAKKTLSDVVIVGDQLHSVNVQLSVGQVTETVTVSESTLPLLATQSAQIEGTITSRELENLPSFSRDPFQLARLAPGVFGNGAIANGGGTTSMPGVNRPAAGAANSIFFIENGPQVIANGARQNSNNIQVDGVGVNSISWSGSAVVTPNEESIKEIKVIANNYSAENGRNSGAQIQVISRNGTNEFHGSSFFKWHRPGLNAFQRWNGPGVPSPVRRDLNRFNQLGGSLGGPLRKNRLFAFFSYEELRSGSRNAGVAWFETPAFRANAAPANSLARRMMTFDGQAPLSGGDSPLTCAQVGLAASQCRDAAGGLDLGSPLRLPLGTADPTFGQTAQGTPYGIGNGFDGIADVMRVITLTPSDSVNQQFNGRLDYQATSKDLVAFSMYWVPVLANSINGPARNLNQWTSDRLSQSWTGIWNRTFSPTVLNEARFGLSGWKFDETQSNAQQPWGLPVSTFDSAGSVGVQRFGPSGPGVFDQSTWNIRDTVSWTRGRHFFKAGGEHSLGRFLDRSAGSARPSFAFRNLWSYANDAPYQQTGSFDPVTGRPSDNSKNLRVHNTSLFLQDDWKLLPNLTLNLGLRYEHYSPLRATSPVISNPVLGNGEQILTGIRMAVGDRLTTTPRWNWGPQVGFSWNPSVLRQRLVLRGGFGVGFNVQQIATLANSRSNPPWIASFTLTGNNIRYAVPDNAFQFSNWPENPNARLTFDANTGIPLTGAPITLNGYPQHQPTPTTYRYSLEAQFALGDGWVASAGYSGSQSRNFQRQRNLNILYYPNLNPRINRMFWYPNDASASYNALLTQLQRRFSRQFTLDVQYRFSRNIDEGSQDFFTDQYPYDIRFSRGPADFDVTHDFKTFGVWTPVFFKGKRAWLEKLGGGWTLSGILNAHSGFPWTPVYNNTGGNVVYPNSGYSSLRPAAYLGGAEQDFRNSTFQRPNGNFPKGALAYFTVPTWPATGKPPEPGVGRNSFRGPRYFGLDFTLAKAFGFPESKLLGMSWWGSAARLNLQANLYNAFNKINLTGINTVISNDGRTSNPLFGQAQSAFSGRIVELQARFSF